MNICISPWFFDRHQKLLTFDENQRRVVLAVGSSSQSYDKWAPSISAEQYLHDVLCGCYTSTTL
jgi:hypothetical protein